jgi:hypothetical protein
MRLVYAKDTIYPFSIEYDYDFVSYLDKGKTLIEKPTKVLFEYDKVWNNNKQFLEHAYFERRTREVVNTNYKILNEN